MRDDPNTISGSDGADYAEMYLHCHPCQPLLDAGRASCVHYDYASYASYLIGPRLAAATAGIIPANNDSIFEVRTGHESRVKYFRGMQGNREKSQKRQAGHDKPALDLIRKHPEQI